jgi:hypothetical protein
MFCNFLFARAARSVARTKARVPKQSCTWALGSLGKRMSETSKKELVEPTKMVV